jgi:gamma-glutamyltranspeptidase / glutathione hydrolase
MSLWLIRVAGSPGRRLVVLVVLGSLVLGAPALASPPTQSPRVGLVAAAHPVAAQAGTEILTRGGNAIDAAVATSAALSVAEPFGSGIGGGGFYLAYRADTGQVVALDCRETAPATASSEMFLDADGDVFDRDTLITGGLSVGAPGQARCWAEAEQRGGRLGLPAVLAPAIRAAREGFAVTPYFAREIAVHRRRLELFPETARRFLPGGRPLEIGSRFVQPELADTLELLASRGVDAFYATIAPEIAAAVASPQTIRAPRIALEAGRLSADDVVSYRVQERLPLRANYRGYTVITHPAPSSGPTLLETLNILEAWDLSRLGPDSPTSVHLLSEAFRVANADRSRWVGDPDVTSVPCTGLLSAAYADLRRQLISLDDTRRTTTRAGTPGAYGEGGCGTAGGALPPRDVGATPKDDALGAESSGTSHLAVIDGDGNAVSFTGTLAIHFGSGITVPGRGFLLNDTLVDFRTDPDIGPSNNLAAPRKRPRSSIAPTLIFDDQGRFRWALGAAGAEWITPVVVEMAVGFMDWGLTPQAAVSRARFHPGDRQGTIEVEPAFFTDRRDLLDQLEAMGHAIDRASGTRAAAQAVGRDPLTGALSGGADQRRDGTVSDVGFPARSLRP